MLRFGKMSMFAVIGGLGAVANIAIVCRVKMSRADNGRSARLAWATIWIAMMESPPRSKKLSCTPTRSSFSTSAQIPARISSVGVRGPT